MTNTSWPKDKDAISRWVANIIGVILIAITTGVYNKMEDFTKYAIENKKDMESIKEKIEDLKAENREQNAHLITHDQLLYLKPEDVQIKFKPR